MNTERTNSVKNNSINDPAYCYNRLFESIKFSPIPTIETINIEKNTNNKICFIVTLYEFTLEDTLSNYYINLEIDLIDREITDHTFNTCNNKNIFPSSKKIHQALKCWFYNRIQFHRASIQDTLNETARYIKELQEDLERYRETPSSIDRDNYDLAFFECKEFQEDLERYKETPSSIGPDNYDLAFFECEE